MKQQLISLLDEGNSRKQYRYLLLDNLAAISELDMVYLDNIRGILGDAAITTIVRPDLSHDLDSCPKLITLAEPHKAIDHRLIHFSLIQAKNELSSEKRYICGWMVSELPPEVIVNQMVVIGQALSNKCNTRFVPIYEPFRMQLLHKGNQISHLWLPTILNCFKSYSYLSIEDDLQTISQLSNIPDNIDIFISEEAKFYQREANVIFALYQAWSEISEELNYLVKEYPLVDISQAYLYAYEEGLVDIQDRFIFSLMNLRYGDLMQSEILAQAVEESKDDVGSLSDKFKQIDRQEFLALATKD